MDFFYVGNLFILLFAFAECSNADNDYDILLFNQQWPKTTCLQNGKKSSQCNIRNDAWSIHGIWATKNFPGKHPENCNYYQPFNVKNLWTIKRELVDKWYNILPVKVENFWKWEWKKHGTCFSDLPELNTQLKYFHQGLQWSKNYVIGNILSSSGIIMGKSYSYDAIQTALKDGLNVAPQIYCYKDKFRKKQVLHEVRICIDKSLQLIDCYGHVLETNCNRNLNIEYPSL